MTGETCRACRGQLPPRASTGRPRLYCSPACRRQIAEVRAELRDARNWLPWYSSQAVGRGWYARNMADLRDRTAARISALEASLGLTTPGPG